MLTCKLESSQTDTEAQHEMLSQHLLDPTMRAQLALSQGDEDGPKPSKARMIIGPVVLACSVLGGSSIGVLVNYVPPQSSFVKNAWRSGILVCAFLVPAIIEAGRPRSKINYWRLFSWKEYTGLLVTLVCQVLWVFGLTYASQSLVQSQAYVFNNLHGLFIVFILFVRGTTPDKREWLGVALALTGSFCMLMDKSSARLDGSHGSIAPAVVDLASAVFGAFYFLLCARIVKQIPICFLVLIMNLHTFFINAAIAKI